MSRKLLTVKQVSEAYPFTEASLRYFIHTERQNGLYESKAVLRLGRKVLIDADRFESWIESRQEPREPQALAA